MLNRALPVAAASALALSGAASAGIISFNDASLFAQWADRGVLPVVPRTTAMRSPDRETLLALLRWFELNVKQ